MAEANLSQTYGVGKPERPPEPQIEPDPPVGEAAAQDPPEDHHEEQQEGPGGFEPGSVEARAYESGWRPKEEFSGEESDWVDAKEFIGRAPLIERIKSEAKQRKRLEQDIKAMAEHNKRIAQAIKSEKIQDLIRQRNDAISDGDSKRVQQIEQDINRTDKAFAEPDPPKDDGPPPEFVEWVKENQWFTKDRKLAGYANGVYEDIMQSNPDQPMDEVLQEVTKETKKAFPESFGQTRKRAAAVETQGKPRGQKRGFSKSDLSGDERRVMERLVARGEMTEKDYLDQMEVIRESGVASSVFK